MTNIKIVVVKEELEAQIAGLETTLQKYKDQLENSEPAE